MRGCRRIEGASATGWHSHGWPNFVVMLTDAVMRYEIKGEVSEVRAASRPVLFSAPLASSATS
jgi:hypothetical protein